MRYFFLFFLYMGLIFCPKNDLKAEEISSKNSSVSSNLVELFKNGTDNNSPLSQKNGIGDWIKTDYGKIRLLSRESGTKGLDKILVALEVVINPEIIIKEPILKLTQTHNVESYDTFIPLSLPLNETKGLTYEKEAVFPILLKIQRNDIPVKIEAEFIVQYCTEEICRSDSQKVSFGISSGYNYFTPFSNFIDYSFRFIPTPASQDQIQAGLLSDKTFWVTLQLPRTIQNPVFLFLDGQTSIPIAYSKIQDEIDENRALFVFRTEENITDRKIILYFSGKNQLFTQTMELKKSVFPAFLSKEKDSQPPFYLWIIFLFLSPCLCLLLQQSPKNEIIAKETTAKNILGIIFGTLCGILIYSYFPYSTLSTSVLWLLFGFLLFCYLGTFSYPVTHFGYGILSAIVPFFSFFKNNEVAIPTTLNALTCFFCILSFLNVLPFIVFLIKPYWLVKMGNIFKNQPKIKLRFSFFLDAILFGVMLLFALF